MNFGCNVEFFKIYFYFLIVHCYKVQRKIIGLLIATYIMLVKYKIDDSPAIHSFKNPPL